MLRRAAFAERAGRPSRQRRRQAGVGTAIVIGAAGVVAAAAELSGNDDPSPLTIALWSAVAVFAAVGAVIEYRRQHVDVSDEPTSAPRPVASEQDRADASYSAAVCQLPPDIGDFTGREQPAAQVEQLLRAQADGQPGALVISAIAGKGGIGKTTLALHVAHRLRRHFADGQLYVNLRGAGAQPLDPHAVLDDFLRALGVPGSAIPDDLEERSGLYRQRLADKKMLIVLDNAGTEAQVRPLLPGVSGCAVIVTSRRPLEGLEGARLLSLDVLDEPSAITLLAKIAGHVRVEAQRAAAKRIVRLCGYLPLAIRIAGGRLAARAHWTLANLAERLEDERTRLTELHAGDLDVRSSFALSYQALPGHLQRAFRLLGLVRAQDFAAWPLAALLDDDVRTAEELIEQLVDAQLLDVSGSDATGSTRYRLHDLLRLLAGELTSVVPSAERNVAVQRLGGAYLALASEAENRFQPGEVQVVGTSLRWSSPDLETRLLKDPLAWLTVERRPLIGMVEHVYSLGLWELTWELAHSLAYFLELRAHWEDWERVHTLGLKASRKAGSLLGEAMMLYDLGALHRDRGEPGAAIDCYEQALRNFHDLQDRHGEALALIGLGLIHRNQGQWEEAERNLRAASRIFTETGDRRLAAQAQRSLGNVLGAQQDFDQAIQCFQRAGEAFRELGDRRGMAYNWRGLGDVYRNRGDWTLALDCYQRSLDMVRELGDVRGEGRARQGIGRTLAAQGQHDAAIERYEAALAHIQGLGDQVLETSLQGDLNRSRSPGMTT